MCLGLADLAGHYPIALLMPLGRFTWGLSIYLGRWTVNLLLWRMYGQCGCNTIFE